MPTLTIDGKDYEFQTEQEARKALAKHLRQQRAVEKQLTADRDSATQKARAAAYLLLSRKASGEAFPRFYPPHAAYAQHLFRQSTRERWETFVNIYTDTPDYSADPHGFAAIHHYGHVFMGAVCNGSGYVHAIILREDNTDRAPIVYAVACHGQTWALADCPGIAIEDFPTSDNQ